MRNFFDFGHLNPRDYSTRVIKTQLSHLIAHKNPKRSLERLSGIAEAGSGDAAYLLGTISEFGLFQQPQNDTTARRLYKLGAAHGSAECQANLAFFLRYGIGGSRNLPRSVALTEACKDRSVWAMLHSSFAHHFGLSVPASCDVGFRELLEPARIVLSNSSLLRRAANPGVRRLVPGRLPPDPTFQERAMKEFHRSDALTGNGFAFLMLSHFYYERHHLSKAKRYAQQAADAGIADGLWTLYAIAPSEIENAASFLDNATQLGSTDAMVDLASIFLASGDPGTRQKGHDMLWQGVSRGSAQAFYRVGMELLAGKAPFPRNLSMVATAFFEAERRAHHAALFQQAALGYGRVDKFDCSCDAALRKLLLFAELSFLFDDAAVAFSAVETRDLNYALRIYQRLADMGSEAAAWNAEVLAKEVGANASDWFELQVAMQFAVALRRRGEEKLSQGDVDAGIQLMKKAAASDLSAKFTLAWALRKTAWNESLESFEKIKQYYGMSVIAKGAVALAIAEKVPKAWSDWRNGTESSERAAVAKALGSVWKLSQVIMLLAALYSLIGMRVRKFLPRPE
jgi:TPR repeat protein